MKKLFFAFLLIAVISFSFIYRSSSPAATTLNFSEAKSGTFLFFNRCTNEDVEITFRSTQSLRGTANGQKFTFKAHYNEHQEGVGKNSGMRYVGHINDSYSEQGSFVNNKYNFSWVTKIKMVAPGGGNNYRARNEISYSLNSTGEVTGYVEHGDSECD